MTMQRLAAVNIRWYAAALAIFDAFYWLFRFLYNEAPANLPLNKGPHPFILGARWTFATVCGLLILNLFALKSEQLERATSRTRRVLLTCVLVIFAFQCASYWRAFQKAAWFMISDQATTTLKANQLLQQGINPYSAHVDAFGGNVLPGRNLDGYKYLPLTLAAYWPLAHLCRDGDQSALTTNFILLLVVAVTVGFCVRKWISTDAAIAAAILVLIPELFWQELLAHGVNDVLPMIPLMLALYFLDRRFLCGLFVGLSISCKLLPGLLWLPICHQPKCRGRYLAGILIGLLPCLPFVIWDPRSFAANVLLFPLLRPGDGSTPLHGLPPVVTMLAKLPMILAFLAIAWRTDHRDLSTIRRCTCAAILTLTVLLAAPILPQNYCIWWFVPFCVTVTAITFNPSSYEWISARRIAGN